MSTAIQIPSTKSRNGSTRTQKIEIFSLTDFKNHSADVTFSKKVNGVHTGETNAAFSDENGALQLGVKDLIGEAQNDRVKLDLQPVRRAGCTPSENENECKHSVICLKCLMYICPGCHQNQHPRHELMNVGPTTQQVNNFIQDYSDAVRLSIKQRFDYQQLLDEAIQNAKSEYETAASKINNIYDIMIERLNEDRARRHAELDVITKEFGKNTEMKREENRVVIEKQRTICHNIEAQKPDDSFVLGNVKVNNFQPNSLLNFITRQIRLIIPEPEIVLQQLIIPDINITMTTTTSCLPEPEKSTTELEVELQSTIGKKGNGQAEFLLPSGICIADDSSLFVADEGNSRIQKINGNGLMFDSFTWKEMGMTMTDVAYDRTKKQIVIPRISSKHGILSCNSFSLVSLSGEEKGRFNVPDMHGGIFIHCSYNGKYLITDVTKKSLSVVKDGQLLTEVKDPIHLKQPAHTCFGNNGEILAVDSNRRNVSVFDGTGQFIRDLITSEVMGKSDLKKPSGISYNSASGVIALADWCGDKVLMYSYDGQLLKTILGFRCPHSVKLTDNNKLVISDCWNSQVKIYSYQIKE